MEQWIHLAETWYTRHTAEVVSGLLACLVVLMIITLFAVRRCRKQVKRLHENTKEFMKYSVQRAETAARGRETAEMADKPAAPASQTGRERTREEEEIFGSVIQEMFS